MDLYEFQNNLINIMKPYLKKNLKKEERERKMFFPYVLSSYLGCGFPFRIFLQSLSSFSPVVAILLVCATWAVEPVDLFSVDDTSLPVNSDCSVILLTFTTNPDLDRTEHIYLSSWETGQDWSSLNVRRSIGMLSTVLPGSETHKGLDFIFACL